MLLADEKTSDSNMGTQKQIQTGWKQHYNEN